MNKLLRFHPRLWIGLIAGSAAFFLLPAHWSPISRVLVSWNCGVVMFLALIYLWMASLTAQQICSRYNEEDSSATYILVLVTLAALLSLVAIIEPLATIRRVAGAERIWHFALATVTVIDSWLLVPTIFTTYYADMYYSVDQQNRPLRFPETDMPVFWDFAYFSFTIAAACQTADVLTTRGSIRKVVIVHELISFLFNASILGFAINVTAGLIGGG
ncbi:MAG TPA: DUF1345 domain-containing protein [Steroidobacteraceae bacterium]|nr:DUF1345 domain-containing protein [Steroidobacteraceae bacterium]